MKNKKIVLASHVLSVLLSCQFLFSAFSKLFYQAVFPQMPEQMARIGLPITILTPVGLLELVCVVVYLVPATSVLGAVLFTGYLGGAILTHLRVGENVGLQFTLGVLIWFALYLREPRLHELLPIRKKRRA